MGKGLILAAFAVLAGVFYHGEEACAQDARYYVPPSAREVLPALLRVQRDRWPDAFEPHTVAAQIEKESCVTLSHSKCWNPRAELKTSREYGFGLGQITVAYRNDGSERFNKFEELRREYGSLKSWDWADRYRADFQLQAIVEMDRSLWETFEKARTGRDRWAFTLSAYNGGRGGVLQDKMLCSNTTGCDPERWFGHVEKYSLKTRKPNPGYGGRSAFDINRDYPRHVLDLRREKYRTFWP